MPLLMLLVRQGLVLMLGVLVLMLLTRQLVLRYNESIAQSVVVLSECLHSSHVVVDFVRFFVAFCCFFNLRLVRNF